MSPNTGARKKRHPILVVLLAILVAVAVLLGYQFYNGTGVFAGNQPATTNVPANKAKVIGKDDTGADITASGTAVPSKLKAEPAKGAIEPPFKNFKVPTKKWHVTSITPSGKLPAPVQITLPLDHKATNNDLVLVAVNHTHKADGWQYVNGTLTPNKRGITFTVTELSWFAPFWANLVGMVNELKEQFFDGMTADVFANAKKPECQNEEQARADDYKINSDSKDTIYWCFGVEGGQRVVKIVNRRHYPLVIKTSNLKTLDRGKADLDLAQLANLSGLILNGGDQATFSVNLKNHGDKATINTDLSSLALGLHAVDVIVNAIVMIALKVNPGTINSARKILGQVLHMRDCVGALGDVTNVGHFIHECFDEDVLKEAFNWQAALLAPVMTAFSVLSLGQAVTTAYGDSKNGRAKYQVTITRPKPNPFASYAIDPDGHWHVHGEEVYIHEDGSGRIEWNAGPCSADDFTSDSPAMCTGVATVRYLVNSNGSLSGKITSVEYNSSDGTPVPSDFGGGDITQGDTFTVSHQKDPHLLKMHWDRSEMQGGNENLCDAYASARNNTAKYNLCGA
jgi:hypothetical protein